jgi:hypothetical protein
MQRMRTLARFMIFGSLLTAAAGGCVEAPATSSATQALACGLFDYPLLPQRQLTPADIPSLTALEKAQIIEAVRESAHTDVMTVEEAFDRVDQHEINLLIARDTNTNQFFVRVEFGAGDNSYGAIFYWDTAVKAAAIHDGFEEECGPATYTYGQGDIAAECDGLLTYINTASYAALDAYLPSNVASGIVAQRPFSSIAGILSVNQLGDARLQQIYGAAVTGGFVGASCNGIHDQHAISVAQTTKLLELANEASFEELHDGVFASLINRYAVASNVVGGTFTTASQLAATPQVGTVGFHLLRNAATFDNPFEQVAAEANATAASEDWYATIDQHFDWRALIADAGSNDHVVNMQCYGIPQALVPQGATYSAQPTFGEDLLETAQEALGMPNVTGHVDPALTSAAFYDLAYRTEFESFLGCRWVVEPDPWSWHHVRMFVDVSNGASYLFELHYEE